MLGPKSILITTPDYPPKKGGLSTYTLNIENTLNEMGYSCDRLVWKSTKELLNTRFEKKYDLMLHIHYMAGFFLQKYGHKHINFLHGSEIMFTSKNIVNRLLKKMMKRRMLSYLEASYLNVFISQFTLHNIAEIGLKLDYGRDIVLHNCIDLYSKEMVKKAYPQDNWKLVCIARDVPHKNLDGVLEFAHWLGEVSKRQVTVWMNAKRIMKSTWVTVRSLPLLDDSSRDEFYKKVHFNLLFSLDHRDKGFYEGFGLTPLEAAQWGTPSLVFNTGGLPESVHHDFNGWVFKKMDKQQVRIFVSHLRPEIYEKWSNNAYHHSWQSHGLDQYKKFLKRVL